MNFILLIVLLKYNNISQNLIRFIAKSNRTRKKHITEIIMRKNPETVGVYRLIMKSGSDNFKASAIKKIIYRLNLEGVDVIIYESTLKTEQFNNCKVINNFEEFSKKSDVNLANRLEEELKVVNDKVYTKYLYSKD